jgi:hypothetical protein
MGLGFSMSAGLRALPVVAAAVFLLIGASASATTVVIDGSYTLSYVSSAGNAPKLTDKLGKNKSGLRTFSESLTLDGDATTPVNFFTAGPTATCGTNCVSDIEVTHNARGKEIDTTYYTASGIITVDFAFSNLVVLTGDTSETGLYQAKYGGLPLSPCALASGPGKTDCITWDEGNDPLAISLTDGTHDYTLDIILSDAEDWAITPKISFQLLTTPVANPPPPEAPIPATLTLFASGIGLLGLLCMRRKKRPSLWDVQRTSP